MYQFVDPRIKYQEVKDPIPVFVCIEKWKPSDPILANILDQAPKRPTVLTKKDMEDKELIQKASPVYADMIHYWWMEETPKIAIYGLVTSTAKLSYRGQDLQSGMLGGKAIFFQGEIDRFKRILPPGGAIKELEMLPLKQKDAFGKGHAEAINIFCEIMLDHFRDGQRKLSIKGLKAMESYFKGLTFGRSYNRLGFFMKAVKEAYEALGFYQKTYSGLRVSSFTMEDLKNYITGHEETYVQKIVDMKDIETVKKMGLVELKSVPKTKTTPPARLQVPGATPKLPAEYETIIKEAMAYWGNACAKARPMNMRGLTTHPTTPVLVSEYGFRGDSRSPLVIFHVGGMHPSSLRDFGGSTGSTVADASDIDIGGTLYHEMPHFDPWLHQTNEYTKFSVFLSISVEPAVALNFLRMFFGGTGYIYLIRAQGAIDLPKTYDNKTMFEEKEIVLPGGADLDDIIAIRHFENGKGMGSCYVNMKNPWRVKEQVLQDQAIQKLMSV